MWWTSPVLVGGYKGGRHSFTSLYCLLLWLSATSSLHSLNDCQYLFVGTSKCWIFHRIQIAFRGKGLGEVLPSPSSSSSSRYTFPCFFWEFYYHSSLLGQASVRWPFTVRFIYRKPLRTGCSTLNFSLQFGTISLFIFFHLQAQERSTSTLATRYRQQRFHSSLLSANFCFYRGFSWAPLLCDLLLFPLILFYTMKKWLFFWGKISPHCYLSKLLTYLFKECGFCKTLCLQFWVH